MPDAVLVSDFDGTMTAEDFYRLAATRLLPPDALTPWEEYRAGRMSHFQALRTIFGHIRAPEAEVLGIVAAMRPDPHLGQSVSRLRQAGWEVVVASAGCDWYIRRLLAEAGVTVELYANPGSYRAGGPLVMDAPPPSPFTCPDTGVDKAAVVRDAASRASVVAFAGDGFADLPASLLVSAGRRFARGDLAQTLTERGEGFVPFAVWSDIADNLLGREGQP